VNSPKVDSTGAEQSLPHDPYRALVEGVSDYAILMLDRDGIVRSWNTGAARIMGYTPEQIVGRQFSVFYPQEAVDAGWPAHELEVAGRLGRFEDEGWRVRKDGSRFLANVVITALYDDDGNVTGFSKVSRDLTEQRRQEQLLRDSEERFRMLVENVKDYALFMLTPEGNVASWNAGAEAIKGYRADEIIGRHFSTFYPPDAIARHWPEHELRMARMTGRFEDEGYRIRKDGSRFWANVVITALFDDKARLRGFSKLTRDLTMRKQVEELQRTERRMNEFLAMLGHELRNPLAPMQTALEVLDLKSGDAHAMDWARKVFGRQVHHLARLVDDLLDVSRITSGKISLRFETLDLGRLVQETVEVMRPQIEARGHMLIVELPEDPLTVRGDSTRLAQILTNLVGNASKYTPDGGTIRVVVERDADFAMLSVIDNGIGIVPELVPRMFDLFVQGDRALDRKEGGLGIGLTLVKRLAELHGGTVAAASAGLRQGSQFTVRIPLRAEDVLGTTTVAGMAQPQRIFRVLVVDDNQDAAQSLAMLLEILGHRVETSNDAASALSRAPVFQPDLVLLDVGLPNMNGYEVARALRAQPSMRESTLVACTGYGQEDDRRKAREAGFDHHLVKPVHMEDLERILVRMYGRAARDAGSTELRD
jgi:PAS domain S-box-containing protein